MGLMVDSYLLPTSKSRDTKTRTKIKNPARQAVGIVPYVRIRGHLPVPILNGGGDSLSPSCHQRVRRPRFPVRRGNFGDSAINKGYIAYFLLRMRETAIFPLPI